MIKNQLKLTTVVLLILLATGISFADENTNPQLIKFFALGTNNHAQADNVYLSVVFDRGTNRIVAINYDPLAPENNTTSARAENVGRSGQASGAPAYMQYLNAWRGGRDRLLSQMLGLNALVLAEMHNLSATGASAPVFMFDGRTLDAISGASMTRNSFINAVLEASRLYRDSSN